MTTPSGQISLNDVNVELGLAGTTLISMNQSNVRTLAGVGGSGTQISMQNLQGKSNRAAISYTFSSPAANASLNLSSLGGYVSGKTDFTITVNGGVYLYATSTGNYGLSLSGSTTGDTLTIVNNGFIMGQGGNGAGTVANTTCCGWYYAAVIPSTSGGPALNIAGIGVSGCTINNTNASAYIGGGGGGGGGANGAAKGGGGAGGGTGGGYTNAYVVPGGSGGGIGSSGSNGAISETTWGTGGGGGRIFPGTGGAGGSGSYPNQNGKGGGSGGGGATWNYASYGGASGAGGSANASGGSGQSNRDSGGGGGGWGASGGTGYLYPSGTSNSGSAGGKAVNTGGKSITWTSGNTTRVYGAVS